MPQFSSRFLPAKTANGPMIPGAAGKFMPYAAIVLLTVVCYWQVLANGFVNYDDPLYITDNAMVRNGLSFDGFLWAFKTFEGGNWHPLTWLSHMLDIRMFALNPQGHHFTNLLLHVLNSCLLYALLVKITLDTWKSLGVALLFAVHPLHVESVAWIAERKDVLSTFFWLSALYAYASYTCKPGILRYLAVLLLFSCGLMSKPMVVSLPLILLLLDFWPLERFRSLEGKAVSSIRLQLIKTSLLLLEKVPFILLSIACGIVTLRAQDTKNALNTFNQTSVLLNSGNAFISYCSYIAKTLWPVNLAVYYPYYESAVTPVKAIGAALLFLALSALILWHYRKGYLVTGWLWFVITLLPVIGFIRVGSQAMADRYMYIPLAGLLIMFFWGVQDFVVRRRWSKQACIVLMSLVLPLMMLLTYQQVRYWRNSITLFGHAIKLTDRNWVALNNLGAALNEQRRYSEALPCFAAELRIMQDGNKSTVTTLHNKLFTGEQIAAVYYNIGMTYKRMGDLANAIDFFKQALLIRPDFDDAYFQLSLTYYTANDKVLANTACLKLAGINRARAMELLRLIR